MHVKHPDGSIATNIIDRSSDVPKLTWIYRKPDGTIDRIEEQTFDGFDPRERPWYEGAKQTQQRFWSDVYIFHTSRSPGITASYPIIKQGKVLGAFGLDIPLEDLSVFVGKRAGCDRCAFPNTKIRCSLRLGNKQKTVIKNGS
jgi:hypothetical protein